MTSTDKSEFDLSIFVEKNKKTLQMAGTAVLVVAAGAYFWIASANRQSARAEQAFTSAERSALSGNPQLAEEDLKRVVSRYASTSAGVRASILLARVYYQTGKHTDGVAALNAADGQGAAKPFKPAIHALLGAGYENQSKFDSAATHYRKAAEASTAQTEREKFRADEARAWMSAGNKPEAIKAWEIIEARDQSPLYNEAKLRLAELKVAPAKGT
jgi:predicted negative regulator of RcsB-dependent stress response